jgi:hypothetical protein
MRLENNSGRRLGRIESAEQQAAIILGTSGDAAGSSGGTACMDEAQICFAQHKCASLFALGVRSVHVPDLFNLWECLVVDGLAVSSLHSVTAGGLGNAAETIDCIRQSCRMEFLRCEVDVECVSSSGHASFKLYEKCVESHCIVSSASPTASPSVSMPGSERNAATSFTVDVLDGDSSEVVTGLPLAVTTTSHFGGQLRNFMGRAFVIDDCRFAENADEYNGGLLVLERWGANCNLYDVGRRAQISQAAGVLIPVEGGTNSLPENVWVRRDSAIETPIFTIAHSTKNAVASLMSRGTSLQLRSSSLGICDTTHASGIEGIEMMSTTGSDVHADMCCAAADVALADIFFSYDQETGTREFPTCHNLPGLDTTCRSSPETHLCGHSCRHDGVCNDGGVGSMGFSCAFGSDCEDCGPRDGTSATAIRLGQPTDDAVSTARDFLCRSPDCVNALVAQYDLFHAPGNTFSNRLRTLCRSNVCNVPGFLLEYDLPSTVQDPTCCIASQIIAARYSFEFLHTFMDTSPFVATCPLGNDRLPVKCEWLNGKFSGVPDMPTYRGAREYMCEVPACISVLDSLFNDMLRMDRNSEFGNMPELWPRFKGGGVSFDGLCDGDASGEERGLHVEVCDVSHDFYFSVPSDLQAPSCCLALRVVFAELKAQGLRPVDDVSIPAFDAALPLSLADAKSIVFENQHCLDSFYQTIEDQQQLHPGVYPLLENRTLFADFFVMDLCWVNLALSPRPFKCSGACCAAVDAVISRLLWEEDASFGQAYFPVCPRSRHGVNATCPGEGGDMAFPVLDDGSYISAAAVLCGHRCESLVADTSWVPSFLSTSLQQFCGDPCRCKTHNTAVGCGYHDPHGTDIKEHDRPYCYVTNASRCASATPSLIYPMEAIVDCPLQFDSCQAVDNVSLSSHACAAFISNGTSLLVKAGETLASTLAIAEAGRPGKRATVASAILGSAEDLLGPWALEAALVSVQCFQAHVALLCRTQLKPCVPGSAPGVLSSRLFKSDCERNIVGLKSCPIPVFNSLLDLDKTMSHCEWIANPLRIPPHCVDEDGSTAGCMDSGAFDMLDGTALLRDASNLGQSLFADDIPKGASEAASQASSTFVGWSAGFDASKALQFVSCPEPFIKNEQADPSKIAPFINAMVPESDFPPDVFYHNRYCVSPCPSFVFDDAEYRVMYLAYIVPGLLALPINLAIFVQVAPSLAVLILDFVATVRAQQRKFRNRSMSAGVRSVRMVVPASKTAEIRIPAVHSRRKPKFPPDTSLLVLSCVMFGFVAILPSAILYHDLPCGQDCTSEPCFQAPSSWCIANRTSSFFLQMAIHCLAWKLLKLHFTLKNDFYSTSFRLTTKFGGVTAVVLPLFCCLVSYAVEVNDPQHESYSLHFIRSGFTCRMRWPSPAAEFLLHYGQIGMSAAIVFIVVVRVIALIASTRARAIGISGKSEGRFASSAAMVKFAVMTMMERAKLMKIVSLGAIALMMFVLSVFSTILSGMSFATYHTEVQDWFDCIKYTFSRRSLFGDEAWDTAISITGSACPLLPQSGPSQVALIMSLASETLIPLLVALFFADNLSAKKALRLVGSVRRHRSGARGFTSRGSNSSSSNSSSVSARSARQSPPEQDRVPPKKGGGAVGSVSMAATTNKARAQDPVPPKKEETAVVGRRPTATATNATLSLREKTRQIRAERATRAMASSSSNGIRGPEKVKTKSRRMLGTVRKHSFSSSLEEGHKTIGPSKKSIFLGVGHKGRGLIGDTVPQPPPKLSKWPSFTLFPRRESK